MAVQEQDWEGPHGMRGRESVIAEPYSAEETNEWLRSLKLPSLKEGEMIVDWDRRVFSGIEASRTVLPQTVKLEMGDEDVRSKRS